MILDGKSVSDKILEEVKEGVGQATCNGEFQAPKLVVLSAKNFDEPSKRYVNSKLVKCKKTNMESENLLLEWEGLSREEFLHSLREELLTLTNDDSVTGYIVQLPLPFNITIEEFSDCMSPLKDIDGFHPANVAKLFSGDIDNALLPCTPAGIMEMLKFYNIDVAGKSVVIVNRSEIVGKPLLMLMLNADATPAICHSKTPGQIRDGLMNKSDIIVTGIGKAEYFQFSEQSKERNIVVIDVSINFDDAGNMCGDFNRKTVEDFKDSESASITPVPGGVGLVTTAMVAKNVLKAYKMQRGMK